MTIRSLMAGYTAYTDAEELTAMRGTHRNALVTTTDTSTPLCVQADFPDFSGQEKPSILVVLRQVPENVSGSTRPSGA